MWDTRTRIPGEQASRGPNESYAVRSAQVRRTARYAAAERTKRASASARLDHGRETALRAQVPVGEAWLAGQHQRSHRGQVCTSDRRGSKWHLRHAASS